jgi:hypothetical protein
VTESLSKLESEVEDARAKLASDLALLRSPQPYRKFSAGLKSEVQSVLQRIFDDLKARAAANPSAALAIGAGVAWKLMRDPPIATALIGAGMLSLWRTPPMRVHNQDCLGAAQQRFGEQVTDAADIVKDYAAETVVATREKVGAYAQSAGETVERLTASAAEQVAESIEHAREAAKHIPDAAVNVAQRGASQFSRAMSEDGVRDQLLLGVAGLAVAAAVGIAYQRRASSEMGAWD